MKVHRNYVLCLHLCHLFCCRLHQSSKHLHVLVFMLAINTRQRYVLSVEVQYLRANLTMGAEFDNSRVVTEVNFCCVCQAGMYVCC